MGDNKEGGTPRWRRAPDDRRGAILTAALREFEANGVDGARMDVIAAAAGLSKGSIYRYFPDKQGLFKATVTTTVTESLAAYRPSSSSDPEINIRRLCLLASDTRFTAAYRLSLTQERASDVAAAVAMLIEEHLSKPFADYLRQAERDSRLSSQDALVLSRLVIATLLGASLVELTTPESLAARVAFLLRACGLDAQSPQADGF